MATQPAPQVSAVRAAMEDFDDDMAAAIGRYAGTVMAAVLAREEELIAAPRRGSRFPTTASSASTRRAAERRATGRPRGCAVPQG